jgi:hypothetical protein
MKYLIQTERDNGPAGKTTHTLLSVDAPDKVTALSLAHQSGIPQNCNAFVVEDGEGNTRTMALGSAAEGGQVVNVLDEQSLAAIGGARDMLEDVAGMDNAPRVVCERCHRSAGWLTTLFGLPPGPASERAAARISNLQKPLPAAPTPTLATAAAAASVAELGPDAGITSDEGTAAAGGVGDAGAAPAFRDAFYPPGSVRDDGTVAPVPPELAAAAAEYDATGKVTDEQIAAARLQLDTRPVFMADGPPTHDANGVELSADARAELAELADEVNADNAARLADAAAADPLAAAVAPVVDELKRAAA